MGLAWAAARSAPRLGFVYASLQDVHGRYYVDAPDDAYVVELARAPDLDGDGSFVDANLVEALRDLRASGGVLEWKAGQLYSVGRYYVHAGDISSSGSVAWSGASQFDVVQACKIPDVRGRTLGAARRALVAGGCRAGRVRSIRSKRARGHVVRTDPPVGTLVPPGTPVLLFVSAGPRRSARA